MLTTICFDADDTLWHNERFFQLTQARFYALLADHADAEHLAGRLLEAERRNLGQYGFGIKGFVLSMIETALDVTGDAVPGPVIRELVEAGQEMLSHPIELLTGAEDAVRALEPGYDLILITKGDLMDQERKLAQSGLGESFDGVEIVSDKTAAVYSEIFARRGIQPEQALMVGNSLKSDVIPMLEVGGWGVHVPHDLEWAIETAETPAANPRFRRLADLSGLVDLISKLENQF